jgi:uncharacterized membrane protein
MNEDKKSEEFTPAEVQNTSRIVALVVYILQVLAFVNGITAIVGVVMNYVKLGDVRGTWLESHYRWQIRTFWFGLLWAIIGFATIFILIGYAILFIAMIWIIYRIVKGWLRLNDFKPVV